VLHGGLKPRVSPSRCCTDAAIARIV
jgi:hypothetical protein